MGFITALLYSNNFEKIKDKAPNKIGIYIARLNGDIVYVGRAIENRQGQSPSGLRKRLQEHWRGAFSGNAKIHKYRDQIHMSTKICSSVEQAKKLESTLIRKYDTVKNGWNKRYED